MGIGQYSPNRATFLRTANDVVLRIFWSRTLKEFLRRLDDLTASCQKFYFCIENNNNIFTAMLAVGPK